MARINPKLNLNKTPQNVDDTSLVFAKNIKLLPDLSIAPDSSINKIQHWSGDNITNPKIVGKIVGINNKIYFFTKDAEQEVGSNIYEYDELTGFTTKVNSAWTYSGGKITGCVTSNNTNESILTVCEYFDDEEDNKTKSIPIKHINLNRCSILDDESIYTQHPNIPITNLKLEGYYTNTIPAGVYQFFIRYKIRKGFYTNWFVCSQELFTAVQKYTTTIQGSIKYADIKVDSNKSFIFYVEHLFGAYLNAYEGFELGFTLSHDGATVARKWRFFGSNDNITKIHFDYKESEVEEVNIDDFYSTNYELFNIKNLVFYKNKLYISNYKETDFNNEDTSFQNFADNIDIKLNIQEVPQTEYDSTLYLGDYPLRDTDINGVTYYDAYFEDNEWKELNEIIFNEEYNNISLINLGIQNIVNISNERTVITNTPYDPVGYEDEHIPGYLYRYVLQYIAIVYTDNTKDVVYGDINYENIIDYPENPISWSSFDFPTDIKTYILNLIKNDETIQQDTFYIKSNLYFKSGSNHGPKEIKTIEYSIGYRYIGESQYTLISTTPNSSGQGSEVQYNYTWNIVFNYSKQSERSNINIQLTSPIDTRQVVGKNVEYNSLLPFTTYDFYCHFVKQNGVITNGYKIGSKTIKRYAYYEEIETMTGAMTAPNLPSVNDVLLSDSLPNDSNGLVYMTQYTTWEPDPTIHQVFKKYKLNKLSDDTIIYPTFKPNTDINLPDGYVGYFITVYKHNNKVSQGFDLEVGQEIAKLDCLECDTMLYNVNENITIYNSFGELVTDSASYADSGDTRNNLRDFGSTGYIFFDVTNIDSNLLPTRKNTLWIVGNNTEDEKDVKNLLKITPFIKGLNSIKSYKDIYSPGYINAVSKLDKKLANTTSTNYYVSGSDIYDKDWNSQNNVLELEENTDRVLGNPNSPSVYLVHSNYNLTYVSLTEDINPQIRRYEVAKKTYNRTESNETYTEEVETSKKQVIKAVNSLTASYILTLEKTFRDYRVPYYSVVEKDKATIFNNTVRASDVNVDEVYRNIYQFKPTDYYNVPTNRGIIINMFSIVNKIYVHTEHGLFVFTDNNMLKVGDNLYTSNDKISLNETEPFNIGVQEIFDSEYGYGGIQDKRHSLVTFNSYIFYDKIADVIYAYSGDTNLIPISDSIYKILKWFKPTDIFFANDNTNNRFFINLVRVVNNIRENICISYSFISKSFVSIHDLDYDESFNSRINTYFIKNYFGLLRELNQEENEETEEEEQEEVYYDKVFVIDKNLNNFNNYNELKKISKLTLADCDNIHNQTNDYNVGNVIDIILNVQYEKVKVLNWINWICSEIEDYYTNGDINLAEETRKKYSGFQIRLYSDETYTPLLPLTNSENEPLIANNSPLMQGINRYSNEAFTYPRYNCGVWSMNYFRDVMNINNSFPIDSDNKSLLYGKYFVVRFLFKDKNFKFENIKFNMNDYEKA